MKKFTQSIILSLLTFAVLSTVSCSKKSDSLHPAPSNLKLGSMTVITNTASGNSLQEDYTFLYDSLNRLSEVIYTTDDTSIHDKISTFTYVSNTNIIAKAIYDKYTYNYLVEMDTFYTQNGQINHVVTPVASNNYNFNGQLVYYEDSTLTANNDNLTYKSYSGDNLYCYLYNGFKYTTTYTYYGLTNRIGDYLQLNSFAAYGFNFYQNAHLVNTIQDVYDNTFTTVSYTIDANNVITQTLVTITNLTTHAPVETQEYDLSYTSY